MLFEGSGEAGVDGLAWDLFGVWVRNLPVGRAAWADRWGPQRTDTNEEFIRQSFSSPHGSLGSFPPANGRQRNGENWKSGRYDAANSAALGERSQRGRNGGRRTAAGWHAAPRETSGPLNPLQRGAIGQDQGGPCCRFTQLHGASDCLGTPNSSREAGVVEANRGEGLCSPS